MTVQATFHINLPGKGEVRGKATREGQLWTLVAEGYPAHAESGYNIVKVQQTLERKLAALVKR